MEIKKWPEMPRFLRSHDFKELCDPKQSNNGFIVGFAVFERFIRYIFSCLQPPER
jgi:hypothetical protein